MSSSDSYVESSPQGYISHLKFANKSHTFAAIAWDCTLSIYDGDARKLKLAIKTDIPFTQIAFNSDDTLLFGGGIDGSVYVIDLQREEVSIVGRHSVGISAVVFNAQTNSIYTSDWAGVIQQWSCDDASSISLLKKTDLGSKVLTFHTKNQHLVAALVNNLIAVLDATNIEAKPKIRPSILAHQTRSVCCHPDQDLFIHGSVEGRVAVMPMAAEQMDQGFGFKAHRQQVDGATCLCPVNALAYHPVLKTFATAGSDGVIAIWQGETQKRVGITPAYHTAVSSLDISADGELVCVALSYGDELGAKAERPVDAIVVKRWADSFAKTKTKDKKK